MRVTRVISEARQLPTQLIQPYSKQSQAVSLEVPRT